jgi:ABC-type transport system involved in cytochrome bd biosynthesis fused ATPase/permease subunit
MLIGLNVDVIDCRNDVHISYAGSIFAYGCPILYLCIQICVYLWLLVWLESVHTSPSFLRRRQKNATHEEPLAEKEIVDEKTRVERETSDPLRMFHLTKSFGRNIAVDDVSLGIGEGEILALLGPNGAGKSTIINMVRGELVPDKGELMLRGTDIVRNKRAACKYLGGESNSNVSGGRQPD